MNKATLKLSIIGLFLAITGVANASSLSNNEILENSDDVVSQNTENLKEQFFQENFLTNEDTKEKVNEQFFTNNFLSSDNNTAENLKEANFKSLVIEK